MLLSLSLVLCHGSAFFVETGGLFFLGINNFSLVDGLGISSVPSLLALLHVESFLMMLVMASSLVRTLSSWGWVSASCTCLCLYIYT